MTRYFKIKTQNFVEIFTLENFGVKVYKHKIAIFCIALFIGVTEGVNQTHKELRNKRCYLWKKELSKLPTFYLENSHFFSVKTIFKTPMILLSIFKVAFPGSEVYFYMEKEHHIFRLNGCEISQLFTEKNDTSFHKKHYKKLTAFSCENLKLLFLKVNLIFSHQKQIYFYGLFRWE